MNRRVLPLLVSLVLCANLSAANNSVQGTLTVNGKTAKLTHAYAATKPNPFDKQKTDVYILFADQALPEGAVHDTFELMRATSDLKFNGLSVEINDEQQIISGMIYSPHFKKEMGQISVTGVQKLAAKDYSTSHASGRVFMDEPDDFFENVFQFDATFDVTTAAPPKPAPLAGKPLPKDGGEPGKAYHAYRGYIKKGDIPNLRKSLTAERAKEIDVPDFKDMFELVQAMQPPTVTITGGSIDGHTATLLVVSKERGENSRGTVTLIKEAGAWKVSKEAWKTTAE
ncbi:MAG TPA: hypothetical protein VGF48_12880 [Thermoanaerobaculia bacterium]|jgi:hypothetical protein